MCGDLIAPEFLCAVTMRFKPLRMCLRVGLAALVRVGWVDNHGKMGVRVACMRRIGACKRFATGD